MSFYVLFINIVFVVVGINGILLIFLIIVGVIGGIGIDFKNWVKKLDGGGNVVLNGDGEFIFE